MRQTAYAGSTDVAGPKPHRVRAEMRAATYAALTSVPGLVAIAVVLLNDHFWKRDSPSWLTGKLSDFAGLFFAPYLVLLVAVTVVPGSRRFARFAAFAAYLAVAAVFIALKLSATTAAPLLALPRLMGATLSVVADPTDLIALSILPISAAVWIRSRGRLTSGTRFRALGRFATLCAATLATVATSSPQPGIEGVVTDAVAPGIAYVVLRNTSSDGVYMTSNGGASWRRTATLTGTLFGDPIEPGTLYLLSGDSWDPALYRITATAPSGLSVKPPSPPGQRPGTLVIVGADLFEATSWSSGLWYFARNGELFRTTTAGTTWTKLAAPGPVKLLATAKSRGVLYMTAPSNELYRSDDAGDHWVRAGSLPLPGAAMSVDPSDPQTLLVGAGKDLLRSDDGGSSWRSVYSDRGQGSADLARWIVKFDHATGRVYAIFGFGCCALLVSTDHGLSWTGAGTAASYVAVDALGSVYSIGPTFTRIFRSDGSGGPWLDVTGELPVKP